MSDHNAANPEDRTKPPVGWFIAYSGDVGGGYLQGFNHYGKPMTESYFSAEEVIAAMWEGLDTREKERALSLNKASQLEDLIKGVQSGYVPIEDLLAELQEPNWQRPSNFREMTQILVTEILRLRQACA